MEIKPPFLRLSQDEQKSVIEVLLFTAEEPITLKYLFDLLIISNPEYGKVESDLNVPDDSESETQISLNEEVMEKFNVTPSYFHELISEINIDLLETNRPYQIINIAGGYQFATRPEYGELLQKLTRTKLKRKFSQAALETLSIIAYKQPVSKPEIEQIRGVNSNEVVNSLLEKNLIKTLGRKDVLGKPLIYGTTSLFLKTFGLKGLEDLPRLREIEEIASDDIPAMSHIELTIDVSDSKDAEAIQETIDKTFGLSEEVVEPDGESFDLDSDEDMIPEDSEDIIEVNEDSEFFISTEEADKNFA